jgi:predicted anti-sigma-YlaC factor YlaD
MEHFSEQAWADFIRGIGESEMKANVESHLARGCSDCRAAFDVWNRVQATLVNETTYTPQTAPFEW